MSYPRIYSLSTIGILKHYTHDYLFHPKRTDFIGSNGVGKSIIADLLQLIFIYDKDLIKFGTDGVKRDERQISSLPYKTKYAYCFLNIEVEPAKFITIGIQINSQKGKRIIPFVITKNLNTSLNANQLALEKNEILFAKDLIKENESKEKEILDIQDLATTLYKMQKLYLSFFKNNEEVQTYYRFLYNKNILPIDLSQNKNLRAFAKVIQSFSKAKTLNLSGSQASKNLKEFLFEESDEDIIASFNKEQYELEKILREYQSLNSDIQTLTEKQEKLLYLRTLEQSYTKKYKAYRGAELQNAYVDLFNFQQNETKYKSLLDHQRAELQRLEGIIQKIPRVETTIRERYEEVDNNYISFNHFEELSKSIEKLKEDINELRRFILPDVHTDWKNGIERIDMNTRNNEDVKREIAFAIPYLEKYVTLKNIVSARKKQGEVIDNLKFELKNEKRDKAKLLSLLQNNEENSLLHWYIQNLPTINSEQLQTVLHFAALPTSEIPIPENSARYINPDELIKNFEVAKSKEGVWLRLGALYEFIQFNSDAELLSNRVDIKQSVQKLTQKLKEEISLIDKKQKAIINIGDAETYDDSLFDSSFDLSIIENSSIIKLETAISCILQIDEKISHLQSQREKQEEELQVIKSRFRIKYDEPEAARKELAGLKKIWRGRMDKILKYSGNKGGERNALKKDLNRIEEDLYRMIENTNKQQHSFYELNQRYYKDFNENVIDFGSEKSNLEEMKSQCERAFEEYKRNYIGVIHSFKETNNEKNIAVQLAVKNQDYSFWVLEEALLGSKIKSTDNIAAVLQEANQSRTSIADGMRDNMIKIFGETSKRYEKYKEQIQRINTFFINRKISGKFQFKLEFIDNKDVNIDYVKEIAYKVRETATKGELQFGQSIVDFIEEFFRKQARIKDKVPIDKLLNPKTYFELSAKLTDQLGEEVPGSTGETYSAIALLGIARLSAVQREKRNGLRFIILEELGSLDNTNFNTFPAIADEFQYQIITMAPHTFNIGLSDEWYAHHLIRGKDDDKINYHPSASYFKTKSYNEKLDTYISKIL